MWNKPNCAPLQPASSYPVQHTTIQFLVLSIQEDVYLDQILYPLKQHVYDLLVISDNMWYNMTYMSADF